MSLARPTLEASAYSTCALMVGWVFSRPAQLGGGRSWRAFFPSLSGASWLKPFRSLFSRPIHPPPVGSPPTTTPGLHANGIASKRNRQGGIGTEQQGIASGFESGKPSVLNFVLCLSLDSGRLPLQPLARQPQHAASRDCQVLSAWVTLLGNAFSPSPFEPWMVPALPRLATDLPISPVSSNRRIPTPQRRQAPIVAEHTDCGRLQEEVAASQGRQLQPTSRQHS